MSPAGNDGSVEFTTTKNYRRNDMSENITNKFLRVSAAYLGLDTEGRAE